MLALVTCQAARHLDADLPLLERELSEAQVVVWDDPTVDWRVFDTVVIRSTWDYHERRGEFVKWARRVESASNLWNPVALIEWNTDKRYLLDLAAEGIPVIATTFVDPGESLGSSIDITSDLVIKPTIGAGSNGVMRTGGDASQALAHITALHSAGLTAMVQPYLVDVDTLGETGLVFLGGEFSHAFGKAAILATPISIGGGLYAEEHIERRSASSDEIAIGRRVVDGLGPTAYARVDLLPSPTGPVVVEVEVTEPSLYLGFDERAAARAATVFRNLSL